MSTETNTPPAGKRRGRRLRRILAVLVVLATLGILLLPTIAAPIVRGLAVDAIEESLHARATIDELTFSLGGSAHVGGIVLVDLEGRLLFSVDSIDASIGLVAALGGTYRFDVAIDGVEVHLRQEEDGSWNLAKLVREDSERKEPEDEDVGDADGDALELHGPFLLTNGRVVVHGAGGTTVVSALALAADFAGSGAAAALRGTARIARGSIEITGSIPGDPSSLGELSELRANVELKIGEPVDLAELTPALAALLPLDGVEGRFLGGGRVALKPGFEFVAVGELVLEQVRIRGTREGAPPVEIERVVLRAESSESGDGGADGIRQQLELTADDFAFATFEGTLSDPTAERSTLAGKLELGGELSRLGEIARAWIAVRAGLELDGGLAAEGDLSLMLEGGAPLSMTLTLEGGIDGLEATDAVEGPIDLGELADPSCSLALRYDFVAGALDVTRLVVAAGPVHVRGVTTLTGLAGGEPRLGETSINLSADLDRLSHTIGALVDLDSNSLGGNVEAHLSASEEGERVAIDAGLTARGLVLPGGDGGAVNYGDLRAAARGSYFPAQARLDLTELRAGCGGVEVDGRVRIAALDREDGPPDVALDLSADLTPNEFSPWITAYLGDVAGEGQGPVVDAAIPSRSPGGSVELHFSASREDERMALDGRLTARGLVLPRGDAGTVDYGDLRATASGSYFPAQARLDLTELRAGCDGVEVSGRVRIDAIDREQGRPDVFADLRVDVTPSALPPWVATYLGDLEIEGQRTTATLKGNLRGEEFDLDATVSGRSVGLLLPGSFQGGGDELALDLHAEGTRERISASGKGTIAGFRLRTLPGAGDADPLELSEDSVVLEFAGEYAPEPGDIRLQYARIDSSFLRGRARGRVANLNGDSIVLDGIEGDFTYVPDRLGGVLASVLPGKLSGAEPEACTFRLDGEVAGFEAASLLAGSTGTLHLGVGRYETSGFDLTGGIDLDLRDRKAVVASAFDANGGELKLGGVLELSEDEQGVVFARQSTLAIGANGVRANSGLGPLLAYVHPAFGGLQKLQGSSLGGVIECDASLSYDGPLSLEALEGGWEALPKQYVNGEITFQIQEAMIAGSPLIGDLLSKFGLGGGAKQFEIAPIKLLVRAGRISYANPWEWKMAGSRTTFGGSIGLDNTVAMNWSIPISKEMVAKHDFLRVLAGQTIDVPIGGTVSRPKLDLDLADLAKDALKKELGAALGLGGAGQAAGDDPKELLRQADRLWDGGQKTAAAKLYQRIRSDFKVSLVYVLNKSRIKRRARYQE